MRTKHGMESKIFFRYHANTIDILINSAQFKQSQRTNLK